MPSIDDKVLLAIAHVNIADSMRDKPRECTAEEKWNGIRCRRYCANYLCPSYTGPKYELP